MKVRAAINDKREAGFQAPFIAAKGAYGVDLLAARTTRLMKAATRRLSSGSLIRVKALSGATHCAARSSISGHVSLYCLTKRGKTWTSQPMQPSSRILS